MIWLKAKIAYLATHVLVWALSGHTCINTMPSAIQKNWLDGYYKGCIYGGSNGNLENWKKGQALCHKELAERIEEFNQPAPNYCEVK